MINAFQKQMNSDKSSTHNTPAQSKSPSMNRSPSMIRSTSQFGSPGLKKKFPTMKMTADNLELKLNLAE